MSSPPTPTVADKPLSSHDAISLSSKYTSFSDEDARQAIDSTRKFAKEYMDITGDPSHDWAHVERVLKLALDIANEEAPSYLTDTDPERSCPGSTPRGKIPINRSVVVLAVLLHDVGDRKYLPYLRESFNSSQTAIREGWCLDFRYHDGEGLVYQWLRDYTPLTSATATAVQSIVNHTSYSKEMSLEPGEMREIVAQYPELAVVQDADRLDALGVIGLGRCFSYNAAEMVRKTKTDGNELDRVLNSQGSFFPTHGNGGVSEGQPAQRRAADDILRESLLGGLKPAVEHIDDKLLKVETFMKTGTGKRLARERSQRLRTMKEWLMEESSIGII
ncbi:MAG: hypothetical protein M1831_005698 [Alyxoria varia]|nr:MAG: hypothetical protein M1831_005698 [Alyxoria varia]